MRLAHATVVEIPLPNPSGGVIPGLPHLPSLGDNVEEVGRA
jgi:hypothetical protein